jgi:hypothetical protein
MKPCSMSVLWTFFKFLIYFERLITEKQQVHHKSIQIWVEKRTLLHQYLKSQVADSNPSYTVCRSDGTSPSISQQKILWCIDKNSWHQAHYNVYCNAFWLIIQSLIRIILFLFCQHTDLKNTRLEPYVVLVASN